MQTGHAWTSITRAIIRLSSRAVSGQDCDEHSTSRCPPAQGLCLNFGFSPSRVACAQRGTITHTAERKIARESLGESTLHGVQRGGSTLPVHCAPSTDPRDACLGSTWKSTLNHPKPPSKGLASKNSEPNSHRHAERAAQKYKGTRWLTV